ncbi:MAG TPA: nitrogen fixation protein NifQ [Polyangiaceae bacterium]|nr:nitrogen fixation protein NifQ [Polyangiaceae bacterium]
MDAKELYSWLVGQAGGGACDGFDAHVLASAVSLVAFAGGGDGPALVNGLGLEATELVALVGDVFPGAKEAFARTLASAPPVTRAADEACLRELLGRHASGGKLSLALASIVARRALEPHHLWQDLGLRNRRELSWLMERHFERLALKNQRDMKWKKFLYRVICRDEGFALCVAPSCAECSDFEGCFGDESGQGLLAHEASSPSNP